MKVRTLGPLEVEDELGRAVELGSPKQQALFALLVIHANHVLSTGRIIDELWGEQPPSDGARNVRVYVSRLREVLEPDRAKRAPGRLIVTEPSGYALRIDPEDIDALRFERLVGEARTEMVDDPGSARGTIARALGLWRDRPLAGLGFEEFAQSEVRRLEELHLSALELRYEASIRVGEHSSTIPDLEKLVAEHPLRERLVALLMEAMVGSGRQAEALRVYRSLELRLASDIGLEPSVELRLLEERILLQQEPRSEEPSLRAPGAKPVGNLPSRITSFVGREADLDEVARLLEGTRLLTLTGPGGVGKTSLAVEATRSAAARYRGGIWVTSFSPLSDSSGVTGAVADVLGVKDEPEVPLQSVIADALRLERSLLLFDNCEHVLDAVSSLVVELLHAVPELTIVCTSRRLVAVDGESVYEVAPLGLPPLGADVDELRAAASSRLFSERTVAVSPEFELTIENAADVATLCRRLDGIPLAIELAASNLRSMTTHEIVESLGDRLSSLSGRKRGVAHHRTLRDTMQWSYDLLEETEQALFDRLSVFAGRFSREAALAVGADRDDVAPSVELAALVDASMIVADVSGRATSYRMLPTLRDFGVFNLREGGELESVRRAHAEYLAADAQNMVLPYASFQPSKRVEQNASVEDFRAAAEWALHAGRTELASGLVGPLVNHHVSGRRLDEAAHWVDRVNQFAVEGSFEQWRLQMMAATIDFHTGRTEAPEAAFRSLSASAAQMGEDAASADALQYAGHVRWRLGDLRGARDDMVTAAEAASASDWSGHARRELVAEIELQLGNIPAAEQQADILATFADRAHDPIATAAAIHIRGWVAYYRGEPEESIRFFEQCRDIAIEECDNRHHVRARLCLARVLIALGLPDQALAQAQAGNDVAHVGRRWALQGQSMILIGGAQLDLGELFRAARSITDGLKTLQDHHPSVDYMVRGLRLAGWIALAHGRSDLAVRFQTAAEAELQRIHYVDPPAEATRAANALTEARMLLHDAERDAPTHAAEHAPFATVLNEALDYLHKVAESPG